MVLKRNYPKSPQIFRSSSTEINLLIESKIMNNESAVMIYSEKLTDEDWLGIKRGHLLIIESDLIVKEEVIV